VTTAKKFPSPGLVPGVHVFVDEMSGKKDVGDRDKPGHGVQRIGTVELTPMILRHLL
jgi:hypothetical protein